MKFLDHFSYIENGKSCLVTKTGRLVGYVALGHGAYWRTMFKYKSYRVHRIVYELHHGEIPENLVINHINGDSLDNRISNLECVTQTENNRRALIHTNGAVKSNNSSGENGVVLQTVKGIDYASARWYNTNGKQFSKSFNICKLGFDTAIKLAKAYREARLEEIHKQSFDYKDINFRNKKGN